MTDARHVDDPLADVVDPVDESGPRSMGEPVAIDEGGDPLLSDEVPGVAVISQTQATPSDVATYRSDGPLSVLDRRPSPSEPRPYRFPQFERRSLANGLTLITADLPGRPLLNAQLIMAGGVAVEPPGSAGVTVMTARAMSEGTTKRDAVELVEAAERLGAEIDAEAGWESLAAGVIVPRSRFAAALELLAEVVLSPSFPEQEVDRLREERLNDLLQARAEPRRRAERVFAETVYAAAAPYSRPLGGTERTVAAITRQEVAAVHARLVDPTSATLIVAGDLRGLHIDGLVSSAFGDRRAVQPVDLAYTDDVNARAAAIVVVDRPGSAQSEVRIGHRGVARAVPEFHAIAVLNTIFGGQFGSRLNQLLREDRGYTYGVHSAFDMRRNRGPFVVRMAVQTEVTVAALIDALAELRRIGQAPVEERELQHARDYLVGVFPLRFEAAPQVATAIAGLVVHDLPDDELDRYRPAVAAVTADAVLAAAQAHIRPAEVSVVIVGDADRFEADLRAADLGEVSVMADGPPSDVGT